MKKTAVAIFLCLVLFGAFPALGSAAAGESEKLQVLDLGERTYDGGPALAVILSAPLDVKKRYDEFLRVSDPKSSVNGAWVLSDDGRTLYFPHIEADTVYSVVVLEGLTSADGKPLDRRTFKAVQTRKIVPAASFASDGLVLPGKLSEGLPVATVNVPTIEIEFFRINEKGLKHFVHWERPNSRHDYNDINAAKEYGEFVYSGRFDLDPVKNKRVIRHVPVMEVEELQKPGVYLAVMRELGEYNYEYKATYFIVTDIGLHARVYPREAMIIASSLQTGEPLPGVKLTFYDEKPKVVAEGTTDQDGVYRHWQSLGATGIRLVVAESEGRTAVLSLDVPALDLSEFNLGYRVQRPRDVYLYSPRDLYRPGETVNVSALLRDYDGRPVKSVPMEALLFRPDGRQVRGFTWQPEGEEAAGPGYYQTELEIPGDAQTGQWRLEVRYDPSTNQSAGTFAFQVEDFMPERMKLDLASEGDFIEGEAAFTVKVDGQYLYGAPAAGNSLEAKIRVRAERQLIENPAGFMFGREEDAQYSDYWELEPVELDENGKIDLTVESKWSGLQSPVAVRIMASLFETGGRPVNRSIERVVWPAGRLIGIRPLFNSETVEAGAVGFEVIAAQPDGSLTPAEGLQVAVTKEDRDYYWEYSESRGWEQKYSENRYVFQRDTVSFDGRAPAKYGLDLSNGTYLISIKDPETGLEASYRFQVGYWWYGYGGEASARPDKVTLTLDKPKYLPGDVIKLTVTPPHSGDARIMVEGQSPLWFKRLPVSAKGTVVEIPVSAAWDSHDLYVSCVVFRPGDAKEKITPNRAVGVVHLPMDRDDRRLNPVIEAPDRVSPQQPLPVTMKIKLDRKPDGPVFVTLAAVDVGILSITDFETPDPFAWFFQQRRYGADQYDMYGKVVELLDGQAARLRCGGDADTAPGGKPAETKVKLVTLFSGPAAFDENGVAEITMTMPHDFNGKVRLMAVAFGPTGYGSAEKEMTVAAPVVTQLSTPRLLAPGDEAFFTLDVHNMSGKDQALDVDLSVTEPLSITEGRRPVPLKDGEKTSLRYTVKAGDAYAPSIIRLHVTGDGIDIGQDWQLGVRPGYPGTTRMVRRVLQSGQDFNLDPALAADLIASSVTASIKIGATLPLNLRDVMQGLIGYPYGCLEQTSSRAYPLLYATPERVVKLNLEPITHSERIRRLEIAIERLVTMQTSTGGFALWNNDGPEEPWLTAYATDFFLQARDQGLSVPAATLDRAFLRLEQYVQTGVLIEGDRYERAELDFAIRAYAAYVLAKVNRAPLGSLRTYYDQNRDKAGSSLPLAHIGLALKMMGDHTRSGQALTDAAAKRRTDEEYWGDYGSPIRDLTLTLALFLEHDVDVPNLEKMMLEVDDGLRSRQYFSTQEQFALFKLGLALEKLAGRQWKGTLLVGGRETGLDQSGAYIFSPTAADVAEGIKVRSQSEGLLFVSAVVGGYTKTAPAKDDSKMLLEKEYYNLEGEKVEDFNFKVGDLLLVHLTVEADMDVPDALVADLLPACFEIENPNFKYSLKLDDTKLEEIQIDGQPVWRHKNDTWYLHQEWRDDRYAAAIGLYKGQRAHMFYLARVVTPGTFALPPLMAESMYRPEIRGIGATPGTVSVKNKAE